MSNIKFKRCLWFVIIFLLSQSGYAQQTITVRAKVVDSSDTRPLIGATVSVRGTSQGVITDLDGFFQLNVQPHHKLVISYIGYRKLIIDAKEASKAGTIALSSDSEELDEVIVVGYGVQKKASTVASISTTKGEDLLKGGNLTSVSEALQGKLNGVVAINSTGMPGENAATIFIRGKASWNGTSPLILVDGIERNMNDVDFNEIESISVLKDASATAVYGVRGANGVILLTTKRGSKQKPKVTFSANMGFKQMTTKLDWADYITSMKMYNEALANDNNWDKQVPTSTIRAWEQAYATGNYGPYNDVFPEVDWFDEITKDFGFSQNYNINVEGGMEKMDYFISLGYQYDGGNYNIDKQADFDPRYYYRRYNWRANFDFKLTSTTTFSANVAGNMGYQNKPSGSANFAKTFQAPTNIFPIKYSDGYWGDVSESGYNLIAN
ncbi:SusC/RagA family TonB-linked outer membrane protein, partial [uncultured Bacteroides sp.]